MNILKYEDIINKEFPILKNDLILKTIKGDKINNLKIPIWVMRQAGRYLPEFREIRKNYDFFQMVQTPEIACQVTLQPIKRYKMDAAIIFSDILILCQAVGMIVQMVPGIGPNFPSPLKTPSDIKLLDFDFDPKIKYEYLIKSIKLTRHALNGECPLIGFSGAPVIIHKFFKIFKWTLMAYMTDIRTGNGSRMFTSSRKWLYKHENESLELLTKLSKLIIELLICQYNAGAQLLMLFESHADLLNLELFKKYSFSFLNMIAKEIKLKIGNNIVFAKGGHYAIKELIESEFDVISLDWSITIDDNLINHANKFNKTLMGNLDPACLYSSNKHQLEEKIKKMKNLFKNAKYIANLGHGIYPDTDPENLNIFVQTIRNE